MDDIIIIFNINNIIVVFQMICTQSVWSSRIWSIVMNKIQLLWYFFQSTLLFFCVLRPKISDILWYFFLFGWSQLLPTNNKLIVFCSFFLAFRFLYSNKLYYTIWKITNLVHKTHVKMKFFFLKWYCLFDAVAVDTFWYVKNSRLFVIDCYLSLLICSHRLIFACEKCLLIAISIYGRLWLLFFALNLITNWKQLERTTRTPRIHQTT